MSHGRDYGRPLPRFPLPAPKPRPVSDWEAQRELSMLWHDLQSMQSHLAVRMNVQGSRPRSPIGDRLLFEMRRVAAAYSLAQSDVADAMDAVAELDAAGIPLTVEVDHAA